MRIWEMECTQFVGPMPADGMPAPGSLDWEASTSGLEDAWKPDLARATHLTGRNDGFRIAPIRGKPGCLLLHDGASKWVGFYDSQLLQLHDDPQYRRRGLAEELIICAWTTRPLELDMTRTLVDSSRKAFIRAHEIAVRRAHARLEAVPPNVLAEYGLTPLV